MDFREGHAEFFRQAPEAGQQDGASEEVILAVGFLDHERNVILDHAAGEGHGIFGQGPRGDVEGLVGEVVVHAGRRGGEERGIALREVGAAVGEKTN